MSAKCVATRFFKLNFTNCLSCYVKEYKKLILKISFRLQAQNAKITYVMIVSYVI